MYEISKLEINAIIQPTVLFSYADKLKVPELADTDTDLPKNLQDNGATPLVGTQP